MNSTTILPDMFYVKAEHREAFLKTVEVYMPHSGENVWSKYPKFLKYRKCDYSNQEFKDTDRVFCVFVLKKLN